jgi:hypothetical protein
MVGGVLITKYFALVTKTGNVTLQVPRLQYILLVFHLAQQYLLCDTHNCPPATSQ